MSDCISTFDVNEFGYTCYYINHDTHVQLFGTIFASKTSTHTIKRALAFIESVFKNILIIFYYGCGIPQAENPMRKSVYYIYSSFNAV